MPGEKNDRALLAVEAATIAVLTPSGRMLHGSSPERGEAPRLALSRSRSGNVVLLRHDVGHGTARAIERLANREPPLADPRSPPVYADEYCRLLAVEAPVESSSAGPIRIFPDQLSYEHAVPLICSDTPAGNRLIARLTERGMPPAMVEMKFVDVGELWAPWCVALDGEEIASIAFTVGAGPESAEVGVATMPAFRGRGFAAAATAGWASLPALRDLHRFYSTDWANVSSQRVVQRLGLRLIGTRFTIT